MGNKSGEPTNKKRKMLPMSDSDDDNDGEKSDDEDMFMKSSGLIGSDEDEADEMQDEFSDGDSDDETSDIEKKSRRLDKEKEKMEYVVIFSVTVFQYF